MIKKFFVLLITLSLCSVAYAGATVKVKVLGMVCSFCATSIEKSFAKESAVSSVKINLDAKLVILELKDGKSISDGQIKKVIEYSGYKVANISR